LTNPIFKKQNIPPLIIAPKQYYEPTTKYTFVCLTQENSAPQITIGSDMMTVSNDKGYRMCRASHPVIDGSWYFEITINPHKGNVRLGWSTERGDSQAPTGYDKYSYSYRDKEGTFFHQSRGKQYGDSFGCEDVIGCYIYVTSKEDRDKIKSDMDQLRDEEEEEDEEVEEEGGGSEKKNRK